jgi:hypothetical protein
MLLIFTPHITNRITYIFKHIFGRILGVEFTLTSKKEEWIDYDGPKISYGKTPVDTELFFQQSFFLLATGIKKVHLETVSFTDCTAFFPVQHPQSALPFDPFSASFYMLSRYEEYLPFISDVHGRFPATESLAYRFEILQKPVVNCWAKHIGSLLQQHFPDLKQRKRKFSLVPTIDIDSAYAIRNKGLVRIFAGLINSLYAMNMNDLKKRLNVLFRLEDDPFDSFEYQLALQKKYDFRPIYFVLMADYGPYDKNIPYQNRAFRDLIKLLADYADVGIHASYASNDMPDLLKKEVKRLSDVLNREITRSRQHFLRLEIPNTYHTLLNMDIYNDYSMGFASQPGFRAGTCDPFPFYDLEMEAETPLMIHPFVMMEGTLADYLKLSPEEALKYIFRLIDEVKAVEGTFISLWHNESLGGQGRWVGWPEVYEKMLAYGNQE